MIFCFSPAAAQFSTPPAQPAAVSATAGPAVVAQPAATAQFFHGTQLIPEGREAIGSGLLPFASQADALAGDIAKSPYIQLLGGTWTVKAVDTRDAIAAAMASGDGWSEVQVPQSQPASGKIVLMRRGFKRPFAWDDREIFLRFQGVGAPYDVYVGTKKIGYNPSPRVGADFDVTKATVEGNNTLTLVLYNDLPTAFAQAALPQAIVEGDVFAISQPKARVRDIDAGASVSPEGNGLLNMGIIVKSHLLNPREIEVFYELRDGTGKTVSSGRRTAEFSMKQEDTVRFFANIPAVKPWSADKPDLYTLLITTQYEGRFGEYIAARIGFRDVSVQKGKFFVNGVEAALTAAPMTPGSDMTAAEAQLRNVKKGGANAVKLTDYPASPAFYALCDRVGIYVCDQAGLNARRAGNVNPSNDPVLGPLFNDRVMAMYNASKEHPSVVMFSLAEGPDNGFNLYRTYLALRTIEGTRPISFAGAGGEWNSDTAPDGSFHRVVFRVLGGR